MRARVIMKVICGKTPLLAIISRCASRESVLYTRAYPGVMKSGPNAPIYQCPAAIHATPSSHSKTQRTSAFNFACASTLEMYFCRPCTGSLTSLTLSVSHPSPDPPDPCLVR
jgi:hypothetical protein